MKQAKTLEHLKSLKNLVATSEPLLKLFVHKFGSLDKLEKLMNEGKVLKLLNKLVKVVESVVRKLITVKVDDILVTNRSHDTQRLDTGQNQPKFATFVETLQPKQSPRFNNESNYYYVSSTHDDIVQEKPQ